MAAVWEAGLQLLSQNSPQYVYALKIRLQRSAGDDDPRHSGCQDDAACKRCWHPAVKKFGWQLQENNLDKVCRVLNKNGVEVARGPREKMFNAFRAMVIQHGSKESVTEFAYLKPGDHIYTRCAGFTHHAIYCGDETVIHFSSHEGKWGQKAVITTTLGEFKHGSIDDVVYVEEHMFDVVLLPDVVIERAKHQLGEKGYHLFFNNCEHFATWCKTGMPISDQVLQVQRVVKLIMVGLVAIVVGRAFWSLHSVHRKLLKRNKQTKS